MEAGKHREIEKEKVNGLILKPEDLLRNNLVRLATDLQSYILSFLFAVKITLKFPASMIHNVPSVVCNESEMNDEIDEKVVVPASNKLKLFKPVYRKGGASTFFSNYLVLYKESIKQMIHNLLFHIKVDETLTAFADLSPEGQFTVVELKDPHGQRIRGMAGEIIEAAGDHALGIKLRDSYKNTEEYDKRLAKWFGEGSKEATENTMAPYRKAIRTLCQKIIECKDIPYHCSDATFNTLLDLPIAETFRNALKPNPNHVVTSGLLFDMQIFIDFISIFEANFNNNKIQNKSRPNLGNWSSVKSYLYIAIVYPALQARTQRIDYEIFKTGIGHVIDREAPDPIDFSKGIPSDFSGFGKTHYFDFIGNKSAVGCKALSCGCKDDFLNLYQAKTLHLKLQNPNKITNRRGV